MAKITLDGITKRYGDLTAVDDVDATFEEGKYTMILGPSGSGKSTLLRIVAGLEQPTEGDVVIDGQIVSDIPPRKRDLSMVFQNLALWDHKTVRENMEFGLKMRGRSEDLRRERVEEIAELLQISDKLDDSPTSLSGGQQQRVALGRSLVRNPDVILLDEPLASLDERLRLTMRTELRRIQRETETTFVHVTHSQEDAMSVADDILLLDFGEKQQSGPPLELYERPANEFVADFIGTPTMNIFDAQLVDDGTVALETANFRLDLPSSTRLREHADGDSIRVGIRPESLSFATTGKAKTNGQPSFDSTVTVVETFGDYNWYYLDGEIDDFVLKSADRRAITSISEGDDVTVTVNPEAIHLFDPETGARIEGH